MSGRRRLLLATGASLVAAALPGLAQASPASPTPTQIEDILRFLTLAIGKQDDQYTAAAAPIYPVRTADSILAMYARPRIDSAGLGSLQHGPFAGADDRIADIRASFAEAEALMFAAHDKLQHADTALRGLAVHLAEQFPVSR